MTFEADSASVKPSCSAIEFLEIRSSGQDDRARNDIALGACYFPVLACTIESRQAAHHQFGTRCRRLILHYGAQVITRNSVGMTGKTLNLFNAQQLSAGNVTGKNQRASSNARGRHACSQSGNAASGNNNFELFRQVFAPSPLGKWKAA